MSIPIHILVVEDSEDDALLIIDELRDSDYEPTYLRVDAPETMTAALKEQPWDIIIADYTMPHFSGPEALRTLHDSGLDIPLILVSGTAEEHTGIEMMRAGAKDFVLKHNLSRLIPAVTREIRESEIRKQGKRAEEAARTTEENYHTMFEHAPIAVITYDRNAVVIEVNPAFEQLFGFTSSEVLGRPIWETFGLPENSERTRKVVADVYAGKVIRNIEYEDIRKDGLQVYVLANITPVYDERGNVTMALAMITDITERKLAEERKREEEAHKQEFYRKTILAFTAGKLVITEPEEIRTVAGDAVATWEIRNIEDLGNMRNSIKNILLDLRMSEQWVYGFIGAIVEAATNAFKHAKGGTASLHLHDDMAMFVVTDTGPGIEALALPDIALTKGYSTAETLGMGYKIMIASTDRIYLATGPEGTTVGIEMTLSPQSSPEDTIFGSLPGW